MDFCRRRGYNESIASCVGTNNLRRGDSIGRAAISDRMEERREQSGRPVAAVRGSDHPGGERQDRPRVRGFDEIAGRIVALESNPQHSRYINGK